MWFHSFLCFLLAFSLNSNVSAKNECEFPLTLAVGDSCKVPWTTLKPFVRPTQFEVGYVSVQIMYSQHFQSKSDAQDYLDAKIVPVVLGPQRSPYLLDHHHTLSALDLSGHGTVEVTILISCDFSALPETEFWQEMQNHQYAFLLAHPLDLPNALYQQGNYSDLPLTVEFNADSSSFTDDPWRTMSSLVQDVEDKTCPNSNQKCQRGYIKACNSNNGSIPYIEFRWGYFMNLAVVFNTSLWDSQDQLNAFQAIFSTLPTPAWPKYVDLSAWQNAGLSLSFLAGCSRIQRKISPFLFLTP
eukprot:c5016_g1_i3.p1 GENE.c5016_g1_i3~~c5016_g1_i3.p1  ORF type:complete len:312 (+),score=48.23 c5016_g1_i3:40-936(+)